MLILYLLLCLTPSFISVFPTQGLEPTKWQSPPLQAVYLPIKLPAPNSCPKAWLADPDKIYVLWEDARQGDISRFQISTEKLEQVNATLPDLAENGFLQSDLEGNLFYFGGGPNHDQVFSYNTSTNVSETVGMLPYPVDGATATTANNGYGTFSYILGGGGRNGSGLVIYDLTAHTWNIYKLPGPVTRATSVPYGDGKKAYVFSERSVLHFSVDRLSPEVVKVRRSETERDILPRLRYYPGSVGSGQREMYVFGGYDSGEGGDTGGIYNLDGVTNTTFQEVKDWPVKRDEYFYKAPGAVLVEELDRVYFFGGESRSDRKDKEGRKRDDIFWVDLKGVAMTTSTKTETTTTDLM